jgi:carbohydrate-selective porin OprB
MKARLSIIVLAAAFAAALLPANCPAEPLERRFEDLERMVEQLKQTVERQERQLQEQAQIIESLKNGLAADGMARMVEPHLDKHILHERAGVAEQLGNIRIAIGLTGVVQGSIDGEELSGEGDDQTDGSWSMDLELESPVGENGLAFVRVEPGQGNGLTDEFDDVLQNVNEDAADNESRFEVTEAWYEHYLFDHRAGLSVGKVDVTNYFDTNAVANDERYQFLNSALVNSAAVEFPDNGLGAVLTVNPAYWAWLSFGWAEGDSDWEDVADDGFGMVEAGFRPNLFEREGAYRMYAWVNGSDKELLKRPDRRDDGWGVGLSFDQKLTALLAVFVRAGWEDEDVYEVEGAWSAGLEMRGGKWNREHDVLGIAVAQALINDKVEPDDTETLFEAYYSIALSERFHLSPDIQIINNPAGDDENDTLFVLGTRAQLEF